MTLLHTLPEDHPLRNTPMDKIGVKCKNKQATIWRPVTKWKIGKNTYNQLGKVWVELSEFGVE